MASEGDTCRARLTALCIAGLALEKSMSGKSPQDSLERGDPLFERSHLEHFVNGQFYLSRGEGLWNIVDGPPPHGFDGRIDGSIGGDDDNLEPGRCGQKCRNEIESAVYAQPEVYERKLKRPAGGLGQRILNVAHRNHLVAVCLKADG